MDDEITPEASVTGKKRTRMVRSYPNYTLEDSLAIARTIHESNAGLPFDRKLLARALGTTATSSGFTMKLNSSAKYGLTQGGYNDASISITARGESIVAPTGDDERRRALIEAATQPDVFENFYRMLNGKRLPEDTYAQNVLQRELGIPPELTDECLGIIKANGRYVGILRNEGDSAYVELDQKAKSSAPPSHEKPQSDDESEPGPIGQQAETNQSQRTTGGIFIGHSGTATSIAKYVSTLFEKFGIPCGAADSDTPETGWLVSARVSSIMRDCSAAILILPEDSENGDNESAQSILYQLGAASVLYGERIVILKPAGVELDPALAAIPFVEYQSENLDTLGLPLLNRLHQTGIVRVTL